MKKGFIVLSAFLLLFACQQNQNTNESRLTFELSFPEEQSADALDGRMLLLVSNDESNEPRFQISDGPGTQVVFGIDVEGLKPGEPAVIDGDVFGYPLESIAEIPAGDYWVQGLLNLYETFHRSDGHTVKLPPDKGEGQHWNRKPGNFYSTPKKVSINPKKDKAIAIVLDQVIPPIPPPEDTKYIKHIKIHHTR